MTVVPGGVPRDVCMAVWQDGWTLGRQRLEIAPAHSKNGRLTGITVEGVPDSGHWCLDVVSVAVCASIHDGVEGALTTRSLKRRMRSLMRQVRSLRRRVRSLIHLVSTACCRCVVL